MNQANQTKLNQQTLRDETASGKTSAAYRLSIPDENKIPGGLFLNYRVTNKKSEDNDERYK